MLRRKFDPGKKKTAQVLGATMAYLEHGRGDPIVLLHGNPTSSYLWRKVIPELADVGRCLAPDLIGMGDSARIAEGRSAYRFSMHAEYLEALLEVLDVKEKVTLVGHDWGGALLFDWGRKNPEAVKGVAFMETILTPLTWDDWPESAVRVFQGMRSDAGEEMVRPRMSSWSGSCRARSSLRSRKRTWRYTKSPISSQVSPGGRH